MAAPLHLPDLTIKNFRAIKELEIPRLARVTLLVGRNGVGKTTILDAIRVYAARGGYPVLRQLLIERNEIVRPGINGNGVAPLDWASLFHGRDARQTIEISTGTAEHSDPLKIDRVAMTADAPVLRCRYRESESEIPQVLPEAPSLANGSGSTRSDRECAPLTCETIGPDVFDNDTAAKFWDRIALSPREAHVVDALRLAFGQSIERVGVVGSEETDRYGVGRLPIVKLAGDDEAVPLRSLGDGAVRLFGISLAIINSRDGILLLDEIENGIYRGVQASLWNMILTLSAQYSVQIVATSQSHDAVLGLARADECSSDDRLLYRLNQDDDGHWLTSYDSEALAVLREQPSEVR